jgi:hypothetical protein
MPNIGSFTFTQWRINMPRIYRPKIRLPARSGVQGHIIMRGPRRSAIASGTCAVYVASRSVAQSLIDNYYTLSDTAGVVSVTDQHGKTYQNVIVLAVSHMLSDQIGGTCRVDSTWQLDVGF